MWVEFSGKREESALLLGAECPGSTLVPVCPQGKAERAGSVGLPRTGYFPCTGIEALAGNRDIAVRHACHLHIHSKVWGLSLKTLTASPGGLVPP